MWNIRTFAGRLLGEVQTADINYALAFARRRYNNHLVTVDNLERGSGTSQTRRNPGQHNPWIGGAPVPPTTEGS